MAMCRFLSFSATSGVLRPFLLASVSAVAATGTAGRVLADASATTPVALRRNRSSYCLLISGYSASSRGGLALSLHLRGPVAVFFRAATGTTMLWCN
jgi:hypothetical protein